MAITLDCRKSTYQIEINFYLMKVDNGSFDAERQNLFLNDILKWRLKDEIMSTYSPPIIFHVTKTF